MIAAKKTSALCDVQFLKKIIKNCNNKQLQFFQKCQFVDFFLSKNGTLQRAKVFLRCKQCIKTLTVLWPQQTVRSSCWSSMFNGIRPEPTNKRFNSAYLQIKFLICRKIHSNTFWLDKTFFLLITSHKKNSSSWKIIEVTHSRRSGRGHRSGVIIILLILFFFFKIPYLVHRRILAPVAAGNYL